MKRFAAVFLVGAILGFVCSPSYPFRCAAARANGATAVVCR